MATDPLTLVDKIVHEVKSQGVFDEFRKDSMADVDTKPAYQNLRQRVETSVKKFLSEQRWTPETNKYQLRERLRRHITESGFLDVGVERIVDQVVNPKIGSVFQPRIEEIAYKYLGIPTPPPPKIDPAPPPLIHPLPPLPLTAPPSLKVETADLMPTDLEQVSPDSDQATVKSEIKDEVEETPSQFAMEHNKLTSAADYDDEDESPPFEPLIKEEEEAKVKKREALVKSEMEPITESGGAAGSDSLCTESPRNRQPSTIAETVGPGATSRDTATVDNSPPPSANEKDTSLVQSLDVLATQESQQLSQVSSNSRLSLLTGTASQEVEEDATENSAAAPAARRQSLDRESAATAAAACNISEEAQMPKFSENSSEPAKSAGGSGSTPARQLHFDIKQDEIKFEGTDRKANLRAIEQEALQEQQQQQQLQQKQERQVLQLDQLERKISDNQPSTEQRNKGGNSAGHDDADADRSQSTADTLSRHADKVSPSAEPVRQDEQQDLAMRAIAMERSLTSSQDVGDSSSAHLVIVEKSEREETTEKSLAAPTTAAAELDRDEIAETANSSSPVVLEAAPTASAQPSDRHEVKSHSESRTSSSRHRKHARPKQRSHDRDRERERERERDRNREKERDKVREKEKEKPRDREKDKEKEKDRVKESPNEKDKENGKNKDKDREKDKDKEREREKDKDREREKDKNKEIAKERDKEKEKEKERDKEKDMERDREKEKEREKDKDKESGREKERGKDKDREKERESEKDKDKIRDKERDKDRDKDKEREKTKSSEKDRENEKLRTKEKGKDKDREKDREREKDKEKDKGEDKDKSHDKESKSEKDRERDRTRDREKSHKNDRERSTRERHTRSKHSGSSSSASKASSSGSGNATTSAAIPSSPRTASSSKEKAETRVHPNRNAAGAASSSPSSSSSRLEDIAADKKDTNRRSERHSDGASAEKRTTKSTSERKSSSSSAATTKDDHNEAKEKPLRRKSTDSNDEDKSAGAPNPPSAPVQLTQNGSTTSSTKHRQKHNSTSGGGGGSGGKYKKTAHELDEPEQLPTALPAEDAASPQAQQAQHRVVILSDILQNPDTDFIELDSQRQQVLMTSVAAMPFVSAPVTTTSAAPPSPTTSPELQFFESGNSDGFTGRLQMLADLIDNYRQVAHCLGITPTATTTTTKQAEEEEECGAQPTNLQLEQPTRVAPSEQQLTAVSGGGRPKRHLNAVAATVVSVSDDCSPTKRGKLSPTSSEASMGSKENEAVDKNTSAAASSAATSQTNQIKKQKSASVKRYMDHTTITKMSAEKLQQQRYTSEDLYKPRPVLSLRSKRSTRHD